VAYNSSQTIIIKEKRSKECIGKERGRMRREGKRKNGKGKGKSYIKKLNSIHATALNICDGCHGKKSHKLYHNRGQFCYKIF